MSVADVLRALALMARTSEEIELHGYEGLKVYVLSVYEDGGLVGRGVPLDEFATELAEQVARHPGLPNGYAPSVQGWAEQLHWKLSIS